MRFEDRRDAGRRLAGALRDLSGRDLVVLGLPRGGVPVAYEVARALDAPLDVIVVCKLGVPFQPELAMGAVGEDGVRVLNSDVIRAAGIAEEVLTSAERRGRAEIERRGAQFRPHRRRVGLGGRTAVVVDDGVATGSTARAACQVARALGAARVVLGVPVAPAPAMAELAGAADETVCLEMPARFFSVGRWYRDFTETSDSEVVDLLEKGAPFGR